jgi:hypothetical protein
MFQLRHPMVIAGDTATIRTPRRLFLALATVATAAATVPAIGLAARPDVTSTPGQLCGIQGTWVTKTVVDSSKQLSDGVTFSHFRRFVHVGLGCDRQGSRVLRDGVGQGVARR